MNGNKEVFNMKIEVWSDYVCPYCYIGKRQLEMAIEAAGLQGQVEVEMKAYQLDPYTPADDDTSVLERLAEKYQTTTEQAVQMTNSVAERAKEVGLQYDFTNMRNANTFKAHRLAKWAEQQGKGIEFSEAVLKAYFIETKKINDIDVLANIIEEIGLSRDEAIVIANNADFTQDVQQDIQEAQQIGVRGVPFFVLNRKYAISGAQPQQLFEDTLRKVAEEEGIQPALKVVGSDNAGICTDDSCDI